MLAFGTSSQGGCWPLRLPSPPDGHTQNKRSHFWHERENSTFIDFASCLLLSDLSRRAVCGVRTVVKLSVKLSGVKVQHKLSQFAGDTVTDTQGNIINILQGHESISSSFFGQMCWICHNSFLQTLVRSTCTCCDLKQVSFTNMSPKTNFTPLSCKETVVWHF